MGGGDFVEHTDIDSTSGFYHGGFDRFSAFYGGAFVDIPVARTGSSGAPFQSWIWSLDPLVDYMHHGVNYTGTGGGAPVTGIGGSLSQTDFLLLLKLTTSLTPSNNLSVFGGFGGSSVRPRGEPTGSGGPNFMGSSVVPAFRAGVEVSQRLNDSLAIALQGFYQHTNGATYDTSLAGERFEEKGNDSFMLGVTLAVGGNAPPAGLPPGGPVISQDTNAKVPTTTSGERRARVQISCGISGANCGAFIWNATQGGHVTDAQRIAIYHNSYKAATTPRPCDVVFYNDADNSANNHVEIVTAVSNDGKVLQTIGQNSDNGPITVGPPGNGGQVMTRDPPPADGPSDTDITNALAKVKDRTNPKDWEEFLKLCRQRNKVDLSALPK